MEKIIIGKIVNAVALRGEVKIYHYSDRKERYEDLDYIYIETAGKLKKINIEKVRYQKDMVILKLEGVNDRNAAEALKEKDVYIMEEDLAELPEDTYYLRDLIGCEVTTPEGGRIGILTDVLQNTAQDVYVVKTDDGKEVLIPAVEQFIKMVDIAERKITAELIEGMI